MNGSPLALFLFFIVFAAKCFTWKLHSVQTDFDEGNNSYYDNDKPIVNVSNNQVTASISKTVHRYFCSVPEVYNPEVLIYGTNSWVFPRQNINLTLSYPPLDMSYDEDNNGYIITGFSVLLFVDNTDTEGFITDGGILQDTISFKFSCDDVTMLMYEFWLFGVPSRLTRWVEGGQDQITQIYDMC